jgi:hypothetical protein
LAEAIPVIEQLPDTVQWGIGEIETACPAVDRRPIDVEVRFTVQATDEAQARRILATLLGGSLDPTSIHYQSEPHDVLDSWVLLPEPP